MKARKEKCFSKRIATCGYDFGYGHKKRSDGCYCVLSTDSDINSLNDKSDLQFQRFPFSSVCACLAQHDSPHLCLHGLILHLLLFFGFDMATMSECDSCSEFSMAVHISTNSLLAYTAQARGICGRRRTS
ncbi:hypothetical protein L596_000664 [Steinernema carpocapsae]|uniref:Uncharacterized protein n=1 Tax=Steinernema carpocapsae TaxID=34508 RepID=A0A4U8UK33_STECR|nr:hypothetical protein L596_000664 [Steinernema carpocapsae]